VTSDRAPVEVLRIVGRGKTPVGPNLPFRPSAKKALSMSLRVALDVQSAQVTAECLLHAVVRVDEGTAVKVLENLGVDPHSVAKALLPLLIRTGRFRAAPGGAWRGSVRTGS
jgi:hypothetical protein